MSHALNLKGKILGIASHLETENANVIKSPQPHPSIFMLIAGHVHLVWTSELETVTHLTSCMHFHQLCKENVSLFFEI